MRAGAQIFEIENAFRQPPEKTRHSVFEHLSARAQQVRVRRERAAEREQVVFVSTCPMQQQKRGRRGAAHEFVNEIAHGKTSGGRPAAICARADSSQGGSFSDVPSSDAGSSSVKP